MLSQIQPDFKETLNTVSKTPTQRKNKNSVQTDFSELSILGARFCVFKKIDLLESLKDYFCYTGTVFNERLK